MIRRSRSYRLYGLAVGGGLELPCPRVRTPGPVDVRFASGDPGAFDTLRRRHPPAPREWFRHRRLANGSTYLRWADLFEFVVSADGRGIRYHQLGGATAESFSTYLLGQVLSFSLLAFGVEPLHGTVVVINGEAIAFLGDCGYGKSTLGAALLRLGHPILTDDLMALERTASGYAVHPGMPRLKLFPSVSRRVLGVERGGTRLNNGTSKQILPLAAGQVWRRRAPLRALYVLSEPTNARRRPAAIELERLSRGDAFLEVIRNTFNTIVEDRDRLANQFAFASRLVATVPVNRLSYPRRLKLLPAVCEAVLADLS
jgi:hypothetical protein